MKWALLITTFIVFLDFNSQSQSGSIDLSFNAGTGPNGEVGCIAVQTNGQVIIGGGFQSVNGNYSPSFARLNQDGSYDNSFGPVIPNGIGTIVAVQTDRGILVGGLFTRLRYDGSVDTVFDSNVKAGFNGVVMGIAIQPDKNILVGGNFTAIAGTNRNAIARLLTNGLNDASFNPGIGISNSYVSAIGLQSNDKIIIGGNFNSVGGQPRNYLARLNKNGGLDSSFDAAIEGSGGFVRCLAVTPQDQIIIAGYFNNINGYLRNYVARLNADGTLDTSFKDGSGPDSIVSSLILQPDGKVLIGGGFGNVNGTNRFGLARLNIDGSLDLSFDPGTASQNSINCLALAPNESVLVGGDFTLFNGLHVRDIVRLNGDGTTSTNLQLLTPKFYFGMNISGVISNTYRVEWTTNLNTTSLWNPLFDVTLQSNPQLIFDTNAPSGNRFYRAIQVSP